MFLHPQELSQIQAHITKTLKPYFLNSLLRILTLSKTPERALPIYNQMLLSPSHHDHFTFTFALKACAFLPYNLIQKGREVHARAVKAGHHSDLFVQNSLLGFYSAACDAAACRRIFSGISSPDVVSWTSLISGLTKNGHPDEALLAFTFMDVDANEMTLVSALSACSRLKDANVGKTLHGICLMRFGRFNNVILENAVLHMYLDCRDFIHAAQLFDVMVQRDVVSWTTIISGCAQHGRFEEAIAIFISLIRDAEVRPNEVSLVCVLRACASKGILKFGKCVHSYSLRNGIGVDGIVGNALINMYSKCGAIGTALKIFGGLHHSRDLVSWCTIMWGMATDGQPKHAIQLFSLMLCYGVQPDIVAFLAVLSACCHAGLIEQCLMFFNAMYEVYGILPEKEHYTCIIDTYGRAGCLKEAVKFLHNMPMKPDRCLWGALVSACKVHYADESVNEKIQKRVLESGVVLGGGTYALLSNMLGKAERWDESNIVRERLNARRIKKLAGYSWIELA